MAATDEHNHDDTFNNSIEVVKWLQENEIAFCTKLMIEKQLSIEKISKLTQQEIDTFLNQTDANQTLKISFKRNTNALKREKDRKEFVSKLEEFSKSNENWSLILIDGDNIAKIKDKSIDNAQIAVNLIQNCIEQICLLFNNIYYYYLGSDNFGLFINNDNKLINVESFIKQIMEKVRNNCVIKDNDNNELNVTTSIGSSSRLPEYTDKRFKWYEIAKTNLLRAKENGGDCYFMDQVCTCIFSTFFVQIVTTLLRNRMFVLFFW